MADTGVDSALPEASFNGHHLGGSEEQAGEPRVISKVSTEADRENGHSSPTEEEPEEERSEGSDSESDLKEVEAVKRSEESKGKGAKPKSEKGHLSKEKTPGKKQKVTEEVREPLSPFFDRPVRERKSIDRFVASAEKEKVRELKIEKGAGILLKDIPNVVFKLSKKKGNDDSIQLLHKLLYGKKVKPVHAKANILQFSGYVWGLNQEKEKAKVKERLDKNNKENIFHVAEILDINFHRSEKKEDIVVKLLSFLESPHKTKDKLLEDTQKGKGKKLKGKKRKIKSQKVSGKESSGQTPKKKQKTESTPSKARRLIKLPIEMEDDASESEESEEHGSDQEEEPVKTKKRKKDESDDEDFDVKPKKSKKVGKTTKKSGKRVHIKEASSEPEEPEEKIKSPKKASAKSDKAALQSTGKEASSKVFSRKKKKENDQGVVEVTVKEPASKESQAKTKTTIKSIAKEKDKAKHKAKEADPSDAELRSAICDLLKEADFSKVTFSDVLTQLETKFEADLSEKKSHVKVLIREEINKIAEEDDGINGAEEEVEEEVKRDESDQEGSTDQGEDADQDEGADKGEGADPDEEDQS